MGSDNTHTNMHNTHTNMCMQAYTNTIRSTTFITFIEMRLHKRNKQEIKAEEVTTYLL